MNSLSSRLCIRHRAGHADPPLCHSRLAGNDPTGRTGQALSQGQADWPHSLAATPFRSQGPTLSPRRPTAEGAARCWRQLRGGPLPTP